MFKRKVKTYQASTSLSGLAWRRFRKNSLSMFALFYVIFLSIIAIGAYFIAPDSTPYANNQNLELATKKPGFEVKFLKIQRNSISKNTSIFQKLLFGQSHDFQDLAIFDYRLLDDSLQIETYTGMNPNEGEIQKYHLADICFALKESSISRQENSISFEDVNGKKQSVSIEELQKTTIQNHIQQQKFLLGTDRFGRDLLSQLIVGSRVSLSVGFIAVAISLIIGISLGLISGYFGGKIDQLIMWFINVVWSIPTLLLVIAITMALGRGFWQVFIAVGLTMWVEVARVVRGQVMSLRNKEFVEAGKALGYSNFRILFKHILPNVLSPLIVISAANFASAILIEAGLSFLGIGVQPPMPSWGTMIKEHYGYIILDYAYLAILPGIAIMLIVLAFMVIGNGLRDALDVKVVKE